MQFSPSIFKAYDIRGLVESELSEELFYRLGRSAIVFTGASHVYIGYDMRPSSKPFAEALSRGMRDQGADVTDIGLISTPLLNIMTIRAPEAQLGAMITASHNPQEYNGCKFVDKRTMMPIGLDGGLAKMRDMMEKNDFPEATRQGTVTTKDLRKEYVDVVYSFVDTSVIPEMRVAIDMGNGIEGVIIDEVMGRLPQVISDYLFKEPDGRFPNHEANPLKHETLQDLQKRVVESSAAMGFAYDGDADRIGLVDDKGEIVPGDLIIALLAEAMLPGNAGAPVIYDLKCSQVVKEIIEANGGRPIESKVGRTNMIELTRREQAILGGELSCHFYFKDFYGFESGDFVMLKILELVGKSGKKLSELVAPLRKYFHSGEINFEVAHPDEVMKKLEDHFVKEGGTVSHLDGVKITFPDWWFVVRKSNTEPLLRFVAEGRTKELLGEKVVKVEKIITV